MHQILERGWNSLIFVRSQALTGYAAGPRGSCPRCWTLSLVWPEPQPRRRAQWVPGRIKMGRSAASSGLYILNRCWNFLWDYLNHNPDSTQAPALRVGSLIFLAHPWCVSTPPLHFFPYSFLIETAPGHPERSGPSRPPLPSSTSPFFGAGLSQGTASIWDSLSPLWPRLVDLSSPFRFHPPDNVLLSSCLSTESGGVCSAPFFHTRKRWSGGRG